MNTKVLVLACVCAVLVVKANAEWNVPDWDEWIKDIKATWQLQEEKEAPTDTKVKQAPVQEADPDAKCTFGEQKSPDKCNTCNCDDEGNWDCTKEICSPW